MVLYQEREIGNPRIQILVDSIIVSGHWLSPQTDDPLTRKLRSLSSPLYSEGAEYSFGSRFRKMANYRD
jgi:hypothetical protein